MAGVMPLAETLPPFETLADELIPLLTPSEAAAYEAALRVQLGLTSPLSWMEYVTPDTERYDYVVLLDKYLVALHDGRLYESGPGPEPIFTPFDPNDDPCSEATEGIFVHPETGEPAVYKLAISAPPRHGKSFLVSEHAPGWILSRHPEWRVGLASYEHDFAADWGKKLKEHLKEKGSDFGIEVSKASQANANWDLAGHRGGMNTTGAGGPFTGRGFHWIVIDDPIKNSEEALSEVKRESDWKWWLTTARTRREPIYHIDQHGVRRPTPGRIVGMATRWHEDDLRGRWEQQEAGEWCFVNLPALADASLSGGVDPLGRADGAALCPQRFPRQTLEMLRTTDEQWFQAMYQGFPFLEGGGIFAKPFLYHKRVGDQFELTDRDGGVTYVPVGKCRYFFTSDWAATTKTYSDFSVLALWAVTPSHKLLLVSVHRRRMEAPNHKDWATEVWKATSPRPLWLGVEAKTFGLDLIQELITEGAVPTKRLEADTDKVARAIPAGLATKNGQVYFPADAEWLGVWEHELLAFPNGTHDDQVDTFAYAAQEFHLFPKQDTRPKGGRGATLEDKIAAHLDKLTKRQKGRITHPVLGRY